MKSTFIFLLAFALTQAFPIKNFEAHLKNLKQELQAIDLYELPMKTLEQDNGMGKLPRPLSMFHPTKIGKASLNLQKTWNNLKWFDKPKTTQKPTTVKPFDPFFFRIIGWANLQILILQIRNE